MRDIRNGQILAEVNLNCCAHSVSFDPTGEVVGVGLENGAMELVERRHNQTQSLFGTSKMYLAFTGAIWSKSPTRIIDLPPKNTFSSS